MIFLIFTINYKVSIYKWLKTEFTCIREFGEKVPPVGIEVINCKFVQNLNTCPVKKNFIT